EIYSQTDVDERAATVVRCGGQQDGVADHLVEVDTVPGSAWLTEPYGPGAGNPHPMPPASVGADPRHATLRIHVRSEAGQLYTGRLVVTVSVNGIGRNLAVGSSAAPLRWVGIDARFDPTAHFYDWDIERGRWALDYVSPSHIVDD